MACETVFFVGCHKQNIDIHTHTLLYAHDDDGSRRDRENNELTPDTSNNNKNIQVEIKNSTLPIYNNLYNFLSTRFITTAV